MGKRKATSTGLKDVDISSTLNPLYELEGVVLREQRLKAKAGAGGGKAMKGEDEEGSSAEVILEKLGDLTSVLRRKGEEPLVSGLREPASRPPDLAGQLLLNRCEYIFRGLPSTSSSRHSYRH